MNNIDIDIEYSLVLAGWVIALLLGCVLLAIKSPDATQHGQYRQGKNTCAAALLIFGLELLFQWLIGFYWVVKDPVLSVSVYLITFCCATLLITAGFCKMIAPRYFDKRQRNIAVFTASSYAIMLLINYFLKDITHQRIGILTCCGLLLLINCNAIFKCVVIYRSAIKSLRVYYSDLVEDIINWMPGVGVGCTLLLVSAPITCLCDKIVGICQLALGIVMFIYSFACIINFSFRFSKIAPAVQSIDSQAEIHANSSPQGQRSGGEAAATSSLSQPLQEVLHDKVQRWCGNEEYCQAGITIEQAAHAMGTNRSYLSRYLNEVIRVTFYEWVGGLRIGKAQALMTTHREMPIEQVAHEVGYTSVSTFSTAFKKIAGVSPKKWRNQQ